MLMPDLPLSQRLTAHELPDAWYVVVEDDVDDWVVRFEKTLSFDADSWAVNMVQVYNSRLEAERTK